MAERKNGAAKSAAPEVLEDNVVVLHKPTADGTDKLVLDFDHINGRTLINCEKQARKLDPAITVLALSQMYQALVAGAATGLKYDEVLNLSGKDFTALCLKAQGFLLQ
ncbi:hypothetical protein [Acidaminococcus sp.]|uniref:hypothetical protein n=1 Tax=Acidaminococcus sp. TaxID=1872103 RepID=UPI003D7C6378